MDAGSEPDLTGLLSRAAGGESGAQDLLITAVYQRLRSLARAQLNGQAGRHTLQPTALVHEAYIKLFQGQNQSWNDRLHFFAAAARAMRNIVVDYARTRGRVKRGGGNAAGSLAGVDAAAAEPDGAALLEIDEALTRLNGADPGAARVFELHYFAGLEHADVAQLLGISESTVRRQWVAAKAWLCHEFDRSKEGNR